MVGIVLWETRIVSDVQQTHAFGHVPVPLLRLSCHCCTLFLSEKLCAVLRGAANRKSVHELGTASLERLSSYHDKTLAANCHTLC